VKETQGRDRVRYREIEKESAERRVFHELIEIERKKEGEREQKEIENEKILGDEVRRK
jgi:hypothetical protein